MWNFRERVWKKFRLQGKYGDKIRKIQIFLTVAVLLLTLLVAFFDYQESKLFQGNHLKREKDATREERLTVRDDQDQTYPFSYEVQAKKYTQKQAREQLEKAMAQLEQEMAGENSSLNQVTKDLYLPDSMEERHIRIIWESDTPSVLGNDGRIKKEVESPILVRLQATLWCEEEQAVFETQVRVCSPEKSGQDRFLWDLQKEVEKADEKTNQEEYLVLPEEVDGKAISWQRTIKHRWYIVLILGGMLVFMVPYYFRKKEEEKQQKRKLQMQRQYPVIVCKMAVLVGAGMTVKGAWQKIVEDVQKREKGKEEGSVYEEMEYSLREMKSGIPEVVSYGNFGERCQVAEYGKFANLLARNVRKGTKGLSELLRAEASLALEWRRQRAEKEGEKTGTKLLAPMFVMLCVVLVIVIVPAFLSVYSTM